MAAYSEYSYMVVFMTVGLFITLPLLLVGFGYSAQNAQLGATANFIIGVANFIIEGIISVFQIAVIVVKYIILALLYTAKVVATGAADTALAEFIADFTEKIDGFYDLLTSSAISITESLKKLVAIYTYIPVPVLLLMLVPGGYIFFKSLIART